MRGPESRVNVADCMNQLKFPKSASDDSLQLSRKHCAELSGRVRKTEPVAHSDTCKDSREEFNGHLGQPIQRSTNPHYSENSDASNGNRSKIC
jgi:hypothetical protein